MKVHATLKNLRIAPRKVRLVTHSLVGVDAEEARLQLSKQVKRSSRPIADLLKSAVANATNNNGLDVSNLYVLEIRVGDGVKLKRWLPRAFGRATPLLRRASNVTIILDEKIEGKNRINTPQTKKVQRQETVVLEEGVTEEKPLKPIKTGIRQGVTKEAKPVTGKVVKKMFQRKSV
ncbi:MAG: 50S ribosomal protein L22 [Minisyncoccota bacterium]